MTTHPQHSAIPVVPTEAGTHSPDSLGKPLSTPIGNHVRRVTTHPRQSTSLVVPAKAGIHGPDSLSKPFPQKPYRPPMT